jgi:hypothetical protein
MKVMLYFYRLFKLFLDLLNLIIYFELTFIQFNLKFEIDKESG